MNAYLAKMTKPMSRTRIYDNLETGYREWWKDGKVIRCEQGILHFGKTGKEAWGKYPDVPRPSSGAEPVGGRDDVRERSGACSQSDD